MEGRELRVGVVLGALDVGICVGCVVGKILGGSDGGPVGDIVGDIVVVDWDGIWLGSLDGKSVCMDGRKDSGDGTGCSEGSARAVADAVGRSVSASCVIISDGESVGEFELVGKYVLKSSSTSTPPSVRKSANAFAFFS